MGTGILSWLKKGHINLIYIGLHFPNADTSPIMTPRNQFVIYGTTDTLNCSYADASVNPVATVERDEGLVENNEIVSATLDDEGEYECDIFLPQHSASIGIPFIVHVIGKLSLSPLSSSILFPNNLFQLQN